MRWAWVIIKSIGSGFVALAAAFVFLGMLLTIYAWLMLPKVPENTEGGGEVGWDLISLIMRWGLSQHAAEAVLLGYGFLIFAIGFAIGFWHFSRPLR